MGGYLNSIPLARTPPILMTVPVAGEGVRIRPDTATWMRRCGIARGPWPAPKVRRGKNHGVRGSSVDPRPPGLAVWNVQGAGW